MTGHRQKLQTAIGRSRIRQVGLNHRVQLLQIGAELLALHDTLAGLHEVDIAAQRVDLAVVSQHAQRMGALPRRERVGAEPGVHQRQVSVEFGVEQVGVVLPQLVGVEQALVHDGEGREGADVEAAAVLRTLVRGPLAQHEDLLLQRFLVQFGGDEDLTRDGLALARDDADGVAVDRNVAPCEDLHAEAPRQRFKVLLGLDVSAFVQVEDASCVMPELR